jgi:hypothetical protein
MSLVKFADWMIWPPPNWPSHAGEIPPCEYTVQAWDTSFAANRKSNYSACVTMGTFRWKDEKGIEREAPDPCLGAVKGLANSSRGVVDPTAVSQGFFNRGPSFR